MSHLNAIILSIVLTIVVLDIGCEHVTGDRCTLGIPNPIEAR